MSSEPKGPGPIESDNTSRLPTLSGEVSLGDIERLAATDSWHIGTAEHPEQPLVQQLEEQLRVRDAQLAALQREFDQRESRVIELQAQLATLRAELEVRNALVAQLQETLVAAAEEPTAVAIAREARMPQRLLVRTEGASGIVHALKRRTTVGRTPDNDLRVDADFVSRHHAALLQNGTSTVVEDLNSTNGTYVNGEQVTRRTLKEGDLVTFGKAQFRFVIKPAG